MNPPLLFQPPGGISRPGGNGNEPEYAPVATTPTTQTRRNGDEPISPGRSDRPPWQTHRGDMAMSIAMNGVISNLFVIMAVEAWMKGQPPLVFIWTITAFVRFTSMPLALAMMLRNVR